MFDHHAPGVLSDLPVLTGGREERLDAVYARMHASRPENQRGSKRLSTADKACEDFSSALANHLPEVVTEARRLIEKMGNGSLEFDLKPGNVTYDEQGETLWAGRST
jgi:hypothetical protein